MPHSSTTLDKILQSNMLPVIINDIYNSLNASSQNELLDDFALNTHYNMSHGNSVANSLYSIQDLWDYEIDADFENPDGSRMNFAFTNFEPSSDDLIKQKEEFVNEYQGSEEFNRWADDIFKQDWDNADIEVTPEYRKTIELLLLSSIVADGDKSKSFLNDNLDNLDKVSVNAISRIILENDGLSNNVDVYTATTDSVESLSDIEKALRQDPQAVIEQFTSDLDCSANRELLGEIRTSAEDLVRKENVNSRIVLPFLIYTVFGENGLGNSFDMSLDLAKITLEQSSPSQVSTLVSTSLGDLIKKLDGLQKSNELSGHQIGDLQ